MAESVVGRQDEDRASPSAGPTARGGSTSDRPHRPRPKSVQQRGAQDPASPFDHHEQPVAFGEAGGGGPTDPEDSSHLREGQDLGQTRSAPLLVDDPLEELPLALLAGGQVLQQIEEAVLVGVCRHDDRVGVPREQAGVASGSQGASQRGEEISLPILVGLHRVEPSALWRGEARRQLISTLHPGSVAGR